ncbi:MAG: M48 family metallopeptidase [Legionella sp.]
MDTELIRLDNIAITIHRKSIKNLHIRVLLPLGKVIVSAPKHYTSQFIYQQISSQKQWIDHQLQLIDNNQPVQETLLNDHSIILLWGQPHTLKISDQQPYKKIESDHSLIHLTVNPEMNIIEQYKLLLDWYQQQMQRRLPELISKWQAIIGVEIKRYTIKKMKTRWGSCNTEKKSICLNLLLIEKPSSCLELVLVHELVHLLEPSHNKRFYRLMDSFLPEWRSIKQILEHRHQFELIRKMMYQSKPYN